MVFYLLLGTDSNFPFFIYKLRNRLLKWFYYLSRKKRTLNSIQVHESHTKGSKARNHRILPGKQVNEYLNIILKEKGAEI